MSISSDVDNWIVTRIQVIKQLMNSATCNSILDFNTLPMLFLQHSSNPNQRGVKGIMLLFKGICVNTSNCNQQFHGTYMYLICFTFE